MRSIPKFAYKFVISPITTLIFRVSIQLKYWRNVGAAFRPAPGGLIPVPNSSGGFLAEVIDLAQKWVSPSGQLSHWLVVNEPEEAKELIAAYAQSEKSFSSLIEIERLESILGVGFSSQSPEYDLCSRSFEKHTSREFDVIVHQSLLEHVIDPIQTLLNLASLLKVGGVMSVQTCTIYMSEHRFPIDTLRFFPDFFLYQQDITGLECLEVISRGPSIFAVLRKVA